MITVFDTKTRTRHTLDGLGGPTPVLLIKDHVQHLTEYNIESHKLVLNAKVLSDDSTINADENNYIYIIPLIKSDQPTVTEEHVNTLLNFITQIQTNDKALAFLESNMDTKTIPSTLIALLMSSKYRQDLTDRATARKFLQSNTCLLKFLDTLKSKPGILSASQHDMASMMAGMGYPPPPAGSGPSNGARTGPQMGTGLRHGGPGSQPRITAEFLQQALSGALRANNLPSPNNPDNTGPNGMLSDSAPTQPAPQPMDGVQESIQQQIADRREQLEILHGMGFNDDLHNIQVLQATNGNVEGALELLFSMTD